MAKLSPVSSAAFVVLGFIALMAVFLGAVAGLQNGQVPPATAAFLALVLLMGTGEAILALTAAGVGAVERRTNGSRQRAVAMGVAARAQAQAAASSTDDGSMPPSA